MRKVLAISVLLLSFTAAVAVADQGEFLLGGAAGVGIPTGDFGDLADPGFSGGVFGDYMVMPNLALGVDVMFHTPGGSSDYIDALDLLSGGLINDASFQLLQFTGHGRWVITPDQQVMPYVVAGGGIYSIKAKVDGPGGSEDATDTNGGIFGGAGVDFKVSPMFRVGVEGAWHDVFTSGTSSQLFTVLGRVSFTFASQTQ